MFCKTVFLEILQNSQENTSARVADACNFIEKETLAQLFSCEFYEISKNTFFHRAPLVATSVSFKKLYIEKPYLLCVSS